MYRTEQAILGLQENSAPFLVSSTCLSCLYKLCISFSKAAVHVWVCNFISVYTNRLGNHRTKVSKELELHQLVMKAKRIPRYWPRNFFGGLARSPASGWTTHRSSTNLEKQKLSHSLKHATNVYKCTDTPATPQIQKLPHFSSVIQKNTLEILLLSITKKVYIFLPERGFLSTKLWSVFQTPLHLNPVKIAFVTSYTLMFHVKFMFSFIRAINPQSERVCFSAAVRFSSSPFPIFFLWGGMWN